MYINGKSVKNTRVKMSENEKWDIFSRLLRSAKSLIEHNEILKKFDQEFTIKKTPLIKRGKHRENEQ